MAIARDGPGEEKGSVGLEPVATRCLENRRGGFDRLGSDRYNQLRPGTLLKSF
jgi:hypothetical protein